MLIEFSVENFLSFKDLTTISMVGAKSFKEHVETHTTEIDDKLTLLKSAIIYGNNASGKSNLLEAMGFMKAIILNSFRDALIDNDEKRFPLKKFILNSDTINNPSFFEVNFIQNNRKYRYGFKINFNKVISEWLYHTTTKEVYLFKRELQNIKINKSAFNEGLGKEEDVRDNVLFLSLLATLGKEISTNIVTWFKNINFINGIYDEGYKRYTIDKLKSDHQFYNWVSHFIKYLEISDVTTTQSDIDNLDYIELAENVRDQEIINLLESIKKIRLKQPKQDQLITYHRKYDQNNILIGTIPFNF